MLRMLGYATVMIAWLVLAFYLVDVYMHDGNFKDLD